MIESVCLCEKEKERESLCVREREEESKYFEGDMANY